MLPRSERTNTIELNGWVGKWDPNNKSQFSPITIITERCNVTLFNNPRGEEVMPLLSQKGPNDCALALRTIGANGPRYGAVINNTRFEIDMTKDQYDQACKAMYD